jgi:hypothetical protein
LGLFAILLSHPAFADTARGKQRIGVGVEAAGRTLSTGAFLDYCLFPRFALGGGYSLFKGISYPSGQTFSLATVYADYYLSGTYWAPYATLGALFQVPTTNGASTLLTPGIGIEYRAHWGLLFRAALYYIASTAGSTSVSSPLGPFNPGISVGLALWPSHGS